MHASVHLYLLDVCVDNRLTSSPYQLKATQMKLRLATVAAFGNYRTHWHFILYDRTSRGSLARRRQASASSH